MFSILGFIFCCLLMGWMTFAFIVGAWWDFDWPMAVFGLVLCALWFMLFKCAPFEINIIGGGL